jgi:hypothetical protein
MTGRLAATVGLLPSLLIQESYLMSLLYEPGGEN